VPLLVDCKPSGVGYMEDFRAAGGLPTLLKSLEPLLDLDARTVEGHSLGEALADVDPPQPWQRTIRTLDDPLGATGSLAVVRVRSPLTVPLRGRANRCHAGVAGKRSGVPVRGTAWQSFGPPRRWGVDQNGPVGRPCRSTSLPGTRER
jgi:hypothetical protein